MRNMVCILLLSLAWGSLVAQDLVKSTGTARLELSDDKSRMQVKQEVLDMALINAIEKAFGRVVVQGNSTYINNLNTGSSVETNTIFNVIANTWVKGEVEEIIEVTYTDIKGVKKVENRTVDLVEIQCEVQIKAREIKEAEIRFTANTLVCPKASCATTRFSDGDDLFLFFSCPQSGYVSVYLDDSKHTARLLPYRDMPTSCERGFPVKADKEYVFFSQQAEHNYLEFDWVEDTYQLFAEKQQDMNRMFVIFSEVPLTKPRLKGKQGNEVLSQAEKDAGYSMPHALTSEDFQRWLHSIRSQSETGVQVAIVDITISR